MLMSDDNVRIKIKGVVIRISFYELGRCSIMSTGPVEGVRVTDVYTSTVSGRYTYRAGGCASLCVAALTREWSVVLQCVAVSCCLMLLAYKLNALSLY